MIKRAAIFVVLAGLGLSVAGCDKCNNWFTLAPLPDSCRTTPR
jgi:hypothetical protein